MYRTKLSRAQKKGEGTGQVKSRTRRTPRILKTVVLFFVWGATRVARGPLAQNTPGVRHIKTRKANPPWIAPHPTAALLEHTVQLALGADVVPGGRNKTTKIAIYSSS